MSRLEAWRRLHETAERVKALAPWRWLAETDVFGVRVPATREPVFVSVMGKIRRHFAVAAYGGANGLHGFLALLNEPDEDADRVLQIPQLQVSFEDRGLLDKRDHETIRRLGLKYRGANAWPLFRSYRPGFVPWFLDDGEVRVLAVALEQTLDVASRARDDRSLLVGGPGTLLVRAPRDEEGGWEDRVERIPAQRPARVPVTLDVAVLERARRLPRSTGVIEVELFMIPASVHEGRERPYFPYMVLSVDGGSGFIFGAELLKLETSVEVTLGRVPATVIGHLVAAGGVPASLSVRSEVLVEILRPLASELGLTLARAKRLPAADAAKRALLQRVTGR